RMDLPTLVQHLVQALPTCSPDGLRELARQGALPPDGRLVVDRVFADVALTDGHLIHAVQKDFFAKQAFEVLLWRRHGKLLLWWFYQWGTSQELAQELRQRIYFRLWLKRLEKCNPGRPFLPWLKTVARNDWISAICRGRRERSLDEVAEMVTSDATVGSVYA